MFIPINEAQVIKSWSNHIKESLGIEDPAKIAWMAKYAFIHDMEDKKAMNEAVSGVNHLNPNMNIGGMGAITFPQAGTDNTYRPDLAGSGDNIYSVLPLALQVAAQTIALDLMPVIPMQGSHGLLQYLDYVYEGGRLHNQGGWDTTTYGNKNTASPYMIKGLIRDIKVDGETYRFKPNAKYGFKGVSDYELTFAYPARIDGMPIFRVLEKPYVNGGLMLGGEGAETPIYELFEGLADGTYTLVEKGEGSEDIELTVGESRGVDHVRAFEDHVTSYSGEGFVKGTVTSNNPYTREMGEATPGRNIGLKSYTLDVKVDTFQVNSAITREQVQDLKQFGIDAVSQVEAALVNELTQCINKLAIEKMFNLGALNAVQLEEVEGRNQVSAIFGAGITTTPERMWLGFKKDESDPANVKMTPLLSGPITPTNVTAGGEVMGTIQRRIMTKILAASNIIAVRGRRGPGTYAIVSGTIATALQDCAGFVAYPLSNTISANGNSLYPVGNLAGLSIYVDPNMAFNDLRVCVGRKGKENEPGLVFMPYLLADKVETTSEFTYGPCISMKSRFAIVEAGQHPQTQFYTFGIKLVDGVSLI